MIDQWLRQRANLNHRWLQNEYSTFLHRIASGEAVTEEWAKRLEEWKEKRDELEAFVNETELALSPRQLLDVPPLLGLPEQHKEWLGPLTHEYYCFRTGIRNNMAQMKAKICEVDRILETFQIGVSQPDAGREMFQACFGLSEMISALPKEIQV